MFLTPNSKLYDFAHLDLFKKNRAFLSLLYINGYGRAAPPQHVENLTPLPSLHPALPLFSLIYILENMK